MTFTIMITTRNRCADLQRTLQILRDMHPPIAEWLITLDACTDDSENTVRELFPSAKVTSNKTARGSVASRDTMLHQATNEWVLSLDDDSYPEDANFFARLPAVIAKHPEAAVITFPELRDNAAFASESKTADSLGHFVSAYPNCAAAMRREFYLRQPGFPKAFVHMYEEPDFALQCYGAGTAVWFEPSLVIRHHLSNVQRQPIQRHHQNARNELWSVWMRCPFPMLLGVSLFRILRQFRYACSEGFAWVIREPLWWWHSLKGVGHCLRHRRSIPWPIYLGWMRLARNPVYSSGELRRLFPDLRDA